MPKSSDIVKRVVMAMLILLIGCAEDIPELLTEEDILAMLSDSAMPTGIDKMTEGQNTIDASVCAGYSCRKG